MMRGLYLHVEKLLRVEKHNKECIDKWSRWQDELLEKVKSGINTPEEVFNTVANNMGITWLERQKMFIVACRDGWYKNPYFPDFVDERNKIIFEIDGNRHYEEEGMEKDRMRDSYFAALGYTIYRIENKDVAEQAHQLLSKIYKV